MTDEERKELAAFDAYWPTCADEMPFEKYRRWCELQIKRRDEGVALARARGEQ